jgi:hypothetical protein
MTSQDQTGEIQSVPGLASSNMAEVTRQIDAELHRNAAKPLVLSERARERLESLQVQYLADLGIESVRIARRRNLETVDESHVLAASERMGGPSRGSPLIASMNTIGGVVAGAGIASVYTVTFTAGPHSTGEILASILLCVAGFVLLAVCLTVAAVQRRS